MENRRSQRRTTRPVCEALESGAAQRKPQPEAASPPHGRRDPPHPDQDGSRPQLAPQSSYFYPGGLDHPGERRPEPVRRRVRPERVPVRWPAHSGRHPRFQLQQQHQHAGDRHDHRQYRRTVRRTVSRTLRKPSSRPGSQPRPGHGARGLEERVRARRQRAEQPADHRRNLHKPESAGLDPGAR